jgi:hypothetical protein
MACGVQPDPTEEQVFGTLVRLLVVIVLVVAGVAFFVGYRSAAPPEAPPEDRPIVGMTGRLEGGLERAGEAVGGAVEQARDAAANGSLAAKIKSKMALDDLVQARDITVRVNDGIVILQGTVRSDAERARAVRLARETKGVRTVTDRLEVLESVRAAEPSEPR